MLKIITNLGDVMFSETKKMVENATVVEYTLMMCIVAISVVQVLATVEIIITNFFVTINAALA